MSTTTYDRVTPLVPQPIAPGQPTAVAPGVYWLRMPLPFALDHINLWLLEDGEGFTLIDCGCGLPDTADLWDKVHENFLKGRPLKRVFVTHSHPDHIGMAHALTERHGAPLWITQGEYMTGRTLVADLPGMNREAMEAFYALHGLVDESAQTMGQARGGLFRRLVPDMPKQFKRVFDKDTLTIGDRTWTVHCGFGHSPEHASLVSQKGDLMISGDMLLPTISTNVSVFAAEPEANPLALFLASVQGMAELPDSLTVLPSHGLPFNGVHVRCKALLDHHAERLGVLLNALDTPKTARDIIAVLFRRELDGHQLSFAMGEAIAHLHYLWGEGKVVRSFEGGVYRFVRG